MKKIFNKLKIISLFCLALCFCGCSTLDYVGEDYNSNNIATIKTNEEFLFNTYKKTDGNINLKVGISKTSVPEILSLFVQVENLSYETPYVFKVEDLNISNPTRNMQFITTNNYLNIYQTQEASSISAMSTVGNTLTTMTGINTNFNEYNQSMAQNSAQESNQSAFSKMDEIGSKILKHSIKHSATISPRKSQYFYFFFEDIDSYPIVVKYKNLEYMFNSKGLD